MTRLHVDRNLLTYVHTNLCYIFTVIFLVHFYISVFIIRYPWNRTLRNVVKGKTNSWTWIKLTQRISAWILLIGGGILIITGLGWYGILWRTIPFSQHRTYDVLAGISLIIHLASGAKSALSRYRIGGTKVNLLVISIAVLLITSILYADTQLGKEKKRNEGEELPDSPNPEESINGTLSTISSGINIGSKNYKFKPEDVNTIRPEIFKPGYFSVFDVLVHLSEQGEIDLSYHFDENLDTHVIDSLNGEIYWWFDAYYSGGWNENHIHRFDLYPWKDGMTVKFYEVHTQSGISRIEYAHKIWSEEVNRTQANNGTIIIPEVELDGKTFSIEYTDVEVTAHNLRSDMYQNGTITAIDVILSLGDLGLLEYNLTWYEEIGTAEIVRSYWVDSINGETAYGRCGFVYETGDTSRKGFQGNHIHIPSDVRVINSPDYVWYFWLCI